MSSLKYQCGINLSHKKQLLLGLILLHLVHHVHAAGSMSIWICIVYSFISMAFCVIYISDHIASFGVYCVFIFNGNYSFFCH